MQFIAARSPGSTLTLQHAHVAAHCSTFALQHAPVAARCSTFTLQPIAARSRCSPLQHARIAARSHCNTLPLQFIAARSHCSTLVLQRVAARAFTSRAFPAACAPARRRQNLPWAGGHIGRPTEDSVARIVDERPPAGWDTVSGGRGTELRLVRGFPPTEAPAELGGDGRVTPAWVAQLDCATLAVARPRCAEGGGQPEGRQPFNQIVDVRMNSALGKLGAFGGFCALNCLGFGSRRGFARSRASRHVREGARRAIRCGSARPRHSPAGSRP